MCEFMSFLVTKTKKVLFSENSSKHEEIIKENNLDDSNAVGFENFCRVEIVPPNKKFDTPIENWIFKIDQEKPEWFNDKHEKSVWACFRKNVFSFLHLSGEVEITSGMAILAGTVKAKVSGSATIENVSGSATIKYVSGSATIENVRDSATIENVWGSATIENVRDSATIENVSGSATIENVRDSATIENVRDSATIKYVCGSATIENVSGSATIEYVSGSATIKVVWGKFAVVKQFSADAKISLTQGIVIDYSGKKIKILKKEG